MKTVTRFSLPFLLIAVLVVLAIVAGPRFIAADTAAPDVAPSVMNYQGYLTDDGGNPYNGQADFLFGIFAANSGGSAIWDEPHNNVTVSDGYFNVLLGSIEPLSAVDFSSNTRYLGVIANIGAGDVTLPRQRLGTVPYALQAQNASVAPWSGLSGVPPGFADNVDGIEYDNVIVVAKSGGDFTSVQGAMTSITDAATDNRYLVWVAPGEYIEDQPVVMKDYVYLVGASQWLTRITSAESNDDIYPPTNATLILSHRSEVRHLTVLNEGTGYRNVAILGGAGIETKLSQVTGIADELGDINYGIFLHGETTNVQLYDVTARAANGAVANVGFENALLSVASVEGGSFRGDGGGNAVGVVAADGAVLFASGIRAEGYNASNGAIGLWLRPGDGGGAQADLDGGRFIGFNAITETVGIRVTNSHLIANNVSASGEGATQWNQGLSSVGGTVGLFGGFFAGYGGAESYGIINLDGGLIEANGITATGDGGLERNDGLRNEGGATTMVTGGLLRGRAGADNRGAANYQTGSILDLNQVVAQGEEGDFSVGASNEDNGIFVISNSELIGDTFSFFSSAPENYLHLTRLVGGPVGSEGGAFCLGVTHDLSFYPDSCPQ